MGIGSSDGQHWPAALGHWLQTGLVDLWGWLAGLFQQETFVFGFWAALLSGALLLIGQRLLRLTGTGLGRFGGLLGGLARRGEPTASPELAAYRARLTEHSLRLWHTWM